MRGGAGGTGIAGRRGGNAVVRAMPGVFSLADLANRQRNAASAGAFRAYPAQPTRHGSDAVLSVPAGTLVCADDGSVLADLDSEGQSVIVARGGGPGATCGGPGARAHVRLELKSIADVALVGFPNAGKSSLLRSISSARPAVAAYPFTTLRPHLGFVEYGSSSEDGLDRVAVADIPGLIEDAHRNVGMGHRFLRHVERTSALLLVVDPFGFQLNPRSPRRTAAETVAILLAELRLYQPGLEARAAAVVVTKNDLPGAEQALADLKDGLAGIMPHLAPDCVVAVSAAVDDGAAALKAILPRLVAAHRRQQ